MEIHNLRNQYKEKIQKAKQNLFHKLRFLNKIDQQFKQIGGGEQVLLKNEPENKPKPFLLTNTTQIKGKIPNIGFNQDNFLINTTTNTLATVDGSQLFKKDEMLFLENDPTKPLQMLENGKIVIDSGKPLILDGTNEELEVNVEDNCTEKFNNVILLLGNNETAINEISELINKYKENKENQIRKLKAKVKEMIGLGGDTTELKNQIRDLEQKLEKATDCEEKNKNEIKKMETMANDQDIKLKAILTQLKSDVGEPLN